MATCRYCHREIQLVDLGWVDTNATGDDALWREVCDSNDTFTAEHAPGGVRASLPMPLTEDDWREIRGGNRLGCFVAVVLLMLAALLCWVVASLIGAWSA